MTHQKTRTSFPSLKHQSLGTEARSLSQEDANDDKTLVYSTLLYPILFSCFCRSRFGPISKIRGSADTLAMVRNCQTSQSQAVIDDETQMTHVVMNSKQMARPAPNIPPAVLNQNGRYCILLVLDGFG